LRVGRSAGSTPAAFPWGLWRRRSRAAGENLDLGNRGRCGENLDLGNRSRCGGRCGGLLALRGVDLATLARTCGGAAAGRRRARTSSPAIAAGR